MKETAVMSSDMTGSTEYESDGIDALTYMQLRTILSLERAILLEGKTGVHDREANVCFSIVMGSS